MTSLRDADTLQPLLETWRRFKYAASWLWTPRSRPVGETPQALNAWGVAQLNEVFHTLSPLMRVRTALFLGRPDAPPPPVSKFTWAGHEEPHAKFEQKLIDFMKECPIALGSVEMTFDLHVWVHLELRQAPVRGWVDEAANVDLDFEPRSPYGALSMNHTLFRDGATHGDSNAELHRLNNPLLKKTLEMIESRLGTIDEVEGLPDVTRTGFESQD